MDTKSIAEEIVKLYEEGTPLHTLAQAYLAQCQEVERLKQDNKALLAGARGTVEAERFMDSDKDKDR